MTPNLFSLPRKGFLAIVIAIWLLTACLPPAPTYPEHGSPPPTIDRGVASISFDDGTIGQYKYARPVLRDNDWSATYYLVSDALTWGDSTINADQARELVGEGHEIGNHTKDHKDLASLPPEQARAELADAQDALESQVGVRPTTCAYPYGSSNAATRAEAERQFKACRSTQGGFNERGRLVKYDLFSYYVQRDTTPADVRDAAEHARTTNTWVVFVYHGVDPHLKGEDDVTPALFARHMKAIKSTGIPVQTVETALAAMMR